MLPVNVGVIDRTLRVVAGASILALAWTGPQTPWGYLGLVPLMTGALAWGPLYSLMGIDHGVHHSTRTHA